MQIKTKMRYHITPVKMSIIKMSTYNKCLKKCGEKETLLHCWWECKLILSLWRRAWSLLKSLKIEVHYDPASPLLGICLEKTTIQKIHPNNHCSTIYIAALFIVGTWKQPKCPPTEEWIKKIRYIYIYRLEYYSAIEKNKTMPFAATWMNLEIITLSEGRQRETNFIWYHSCFCCRC